jgi:uncharacterized protein (DUF488 family)
MRRLYTIGHSNHPLETFLALLRQHDVSAVIDVRAAPYSRFNPQYAYHAIRSSLAAAGLRYVYLGRELGSRRAQAQSQGGVGLSYDRIAGSETFKAGLAALKRIMAKEQAVLMCAEKEPTACHRTLLVARHLRAADLSIHHIRADGSLEDHQDLERRLVEMHRLPVQNLFGGFDNPVERAYALQEERLSRGRSG